jgi:hypothetical protein
MRRALVGMLVSAVAALGLGGVTAFASDGAATPFKATYPTPSIDGGFSTWTCSGAHVVNRVSFKDSETCLVTGDVSGYVAGTYSGSPSGPLAGSVFGANTEWGSDSPLENGAAAISWTITLIDNGDGTWTVDILAYYAS